MKHVIELESSLELGQRLPPTALGRVLLGLESLIRKAVLMTFEGRSTVGGKAPYWLSSAVDVRFIALGGNRDSLLYFDAPLLGDAAAVLYEQGEFWPTKPDPESTAFDLLSGTLTDIGSKNIDSDRFDNPFLRTIATYGRKTLNGVFQTMRIGSAHRPEASKATFTKETVVLAEWMSKETPPSQRIHVVGKLDMLKASTHRFGMELDDGQYVNGVFISGNMDSLGPLFEKRVLVLGTAVYRPSGTLLRVDAESITPGGNEPSFWSKIPAPARTRISKEEIRQPQTRKTGAAAIFGKWPGEETEEDLLKALTST